jgi:3,4-dihydroxy-2-butanone 4-phosphate synthase
MFSLTPRVETLPFLLIATNKMQRYTIFFITVKALHVSGGISAHHQELKTVHTASCICQAQQASLARHFAAVLTACNTVH